MEIVLICGGQRSDFNKYSYRAAWLPNAIIKVWHRYNKEFLNTAGTCRSHGYFYGDHVLTTFMKVRRFHLMSNLMTLNWQITISKKFVYTTVSKF